MAYHSGYVAHGAWGAGWAGARADRPEECRLRGPLTLRERGGRDRCPGRRMSFRLLPRKTVQRVLNFALSAQT